MALVVCSDAVELAYNESIDNFEIIMKCLLFKRRRLDFLFVALSVLVCSVPVVLGRLCTIL